jgi:hypothetical protein
MDSLYIILIILIFILTFCILAIFFMNILNDNLKNIKINLFNNNESSLQNNNITEQNKNDLRHTLYSDIMVEGFDNNNSKFTRADQYARDLKYDDISKFYYEKDNIDFTEKSDKRRNYPHPDEMSGLEKQNFIYNYPKNLTLKDYENWLKLQIYLERKNKISDIHHKYYERVKKGKSLKYEYKKCPPEDNMPLFMAGNEVFDFYKNIYDAEKIKVNQDITILTNNIDGYNIEVYPIV